MSKASEWAAKYRKADEAQGFTWQRIREAEKGRPTFTVFDPEYAGERQHVASVTDEGKMALDDWPHVDRERAIAWAHWILDTFGDDKP